MIVNALRVIPDAPAPDYFADEAGNIWLIRDRGNPIRRKAKQREEDGYIPIVIQFAGTRYNRYLHRLVCTAFHGPPPEGMQASHLDGKQDDNRPNNLAWETPKKNTNRKREHGTMEVARVIDEEDHFAIEEMLRSGLRQKEIADILGVSQATVSKVKLNHTNLIPGKRRLSDEELLEVRHLIEIEGLSQAKIGKRYGVTQSAIWRIKNRDYKFA